MANSNLTRAKNAKNDEFYTQYHDIEKEISAYLEYNPDIFRDKTILLPCDDPEWSNFTKFFAQKFQEFGLKKLISTSYAAESKHLKEIYQPSLFEQSSPQYDKKKTAKNGKIFTLTQDKTGEGKVNVEDLEWQYLKGDGDFRSDEIKKLRDEADIIITNPPFSLFREFLEWITEVNKQFVVIGNMNAITYKEIFPLIKENKMWLGQSISSGDREFEVPESYPLESAGWRIDEAGKRYIRVKGVRWFTNIDHGKRHQLLPLMSMEDNKRFNNKVQTNPNSYQKYDNYDAIEIPYTNAIPSDYDGIMGVPISFLDKYSPEQFEIIGLGIANLGLSIGVRPYKPEHRKYRKEVQKRGVVDGDLYMIKNGLVEVPYARVLIKHKR